MKEAVVKLCDCGCGNAASIAKHTNKRLNHIDGEYVRFVRGHNGRKMQAGERSSYNWKGGLTKNSHGRIKLCIPSHNRSDSYGYVLRAIVIAEKALGKQLRSNQVVHHADEDANNDAKPNLVICQDQGYHMLLHQRKRAYNTCGNANWRKCKICKQYDSLKNLYMDISNGSTYHRLCKNKYARKLYRSKIDENNSIQNTK